MPLGKWSSNLLWKVRLNSINNLLLILYKLSPSNLQTDYFIFFIITNYSIVFDFRDFAQKYYMLTYCRKRYSTMYIQINLHNFKVIYIYISASPSEIWMDISLGHQFYKTCTNVKVKRLPLNSD